MLTVLLAILTGLVVVIVMIFLVSLIANCLFDKKVKHEVEDFFKDCSVSNNQIVHKADLAGLPKCVQKWLEYAQVIGQEKIETVCLHQQGQLRMKEEQAWMPAEAVQYIRTDRPGFIWQVKVTAPFFFLVGRDKYSEGRGNMLIKLLALIKVANAKGREIDQGAMLRYLAEMVWYPTAALNNYITWEEKAANSAKAIMTYQGVTVAGVFTFNQKGEVINFVAQRYMDSKGQYSLETWSTPMGKYQEFHGIRIPTKGQAIWKLKTGDFNWFKVDITEIDYNASVGS